MSGILLRLPREALRAALRHPLDGCQSCAGGMCLQYIVSTIPEASPPQGFVSLTNLSCSMFTPYSFLPTSPLTVSQFITDIALLLMGQLVVTISAIVVFFYFGILLYIDVIYTRSLFGVFYIYNQFNSNYTIQYCFNYLFISKEQFVYSIIISFRYILLYLLLIITKYICP